MKKKIAIIAGGDSGEYDISVRSANVVCSSLDSEKFEGYLIRIRGRDWFYEKGESKYPLDKNDFSLTLNDRRLTFDAVFCAIHGTPGENGKLPAYFDMIGLPYTSCDPITSALTFNKNFCNRLVASYGIKVAPSMRFYKGDQDIDKSISSQLNLPVFIKPNCGGSSVGMSKINSVSEIPDAFVKAFREDDEILVEEFIPGRELTCGVLQTKGKMIVFPVTEIISKKEFFDYEAKYTPSLAEEIIPAKITVSAEALIKDTSAYLYKQLNCRGVVRFDYILSAKDKLLYFLEVNTVPGLSRESIIPKMAGEMDISPQQLFTMLIEDALWRHENRNK